MNISNYGSPVLPFSVAEAFCNSQDIAAFAEPAACNFYFNNYDTSKMVIGDSGVFLRNSFKELPLYEDQGLCITATLDINSIHFATAWHILSSSFAVDECRSLSGQIACLSQKDYRFSAIMDQERMVGILGLWIFDNLLYIEHLAIAPEMRSAGYGSRILQLLQTSFKGLIVLDVECPQSSVEARRRIAFYQRQGFTLDTEVVSLESYTNKTPFLVQLMTWPCDLNAGTRQSVLETIEPDFYAPAVTLATARHAI